MMVEIKINFIKMTSLNVLVGICIWDATAKKGLEIFNSNKIKDFNTPCGSSETYSDLREQKIYEEYV